MSGSLRDFLVNLASSTTLMSEFAADPAGVLDRAGLSPEEKAAVLARDSDRLRAALGASAADHLTQVSLVRGRKTARKRSASKKPGAKKRPASKKRRTGTKKR
jgi:hypothetical protein